MSPEPTGKGCIGVAINDLEILQNTVWKPRLAMIFRQPPYGLDAEEGASCPIGHVDCDIQDLEQKAFKSRLFDSFSNI
jgi:hypothetical protein